MAEAVPDGESAQASAQELDTVLHSRGYLVLLLMSGLIGIPISFVAFGFLAVVHELEHRVWHTVPEDLGFDTLPWWWAIAALTLAGVLVGLAVTRLPGHGGHVPVEGMGGATPPSHLPGVVLAAGASLVLGAVVGPEAPLIALGGGLAILAAARLTEAENAQRVLAVAGSAAAISAIFGNPLVAAILLLEALGLARRQTMMVLLPCLVSSGVGALIFTGLGNWTGLGIGALSIPDLKVVPLEVPDVLWALPVGAVVALGTWAVFVVGRRTAHAARSHPFAVTVAAGVVAGSLAALYALVTDHSADEVALSGQATLATLGSDPDAWTGGALVMLLLCKGLAYAVCIGAFRGGQVFPAVFLGATFGILASTVLPGPGTVAGLAIGMAAGAAVIRMPVTSILLVVLLLGGAAIDLIPVIILAAVTAFVIDELLNTWSDSPVPAS